MRKKQTSKAKSKHSEVQRDSCAYDAVSCKAMALLDPSINTKCLLTEVFTISTHKIKQHFLTNQILECNSVVH